MCIDPQDIDPDTGLPYPGYSSPALDEPYDPEEEEDDYDDSYPPPCTDASGHLWVCSDENEEICYCATCGADGNA